MLKDFGKKLKETGQNAVNQTKKVAEIANLNVKTTKRNDDLSKAVLALGKKFYQNSKEKVPKEYAAEFAAIEEIKQDIREMKQKIAELKESNGIKEEISDTSDEPAVEIDAKEETKPEAKD